MAEHFYGRDFTVHTSNGAAEEMLRAWVALLDRRHLTQDEHELLAFFRSRLEKGNGWRSFGLNPPPTEIASHQKLRVFANIIECFAIDLTKKHPDPSLTNVTWDRALRLQWLAKMIDLHRLVGLAIEDESNRPKDLDLAQSLNADDRNECELARLLDRHADHERRATQSAITEPIENRIERLSELIRVADSCRQSNTIQGTMANLLNDRGSVRAELGNADEALADLRRSAEIDPSAESRRITLDMIAVMEESKID